MKTPQTDAALEHLKCDQLTSAQQEIERLKSTDEACGAIHGICSDAGIPCGHVVDRVRALLNQRAARKADAK